MKSRQKTKAENGGEIIIAFTTLYNKQPNKIQEKKAEIALALKKGFLDGGVLKSGTLLLRFRDGTRVYITRKGKLTVRRPRRK